MRTNIAPFLLRSYQSSNPGPMQVFTFRKKASFYGEELLAPRPTPKLEGPPLVGCLRLFIQYIRSYPPYRRPSLHPQLEDAPFRGDRGPLITEYMSPQSQIIVYYRPY